MDDLEEGKRGIDDLIFPRKKTLTDLWREEWERGLSKMVKDKYKNDFQRKYQFIIMLKLLSIKLYSIVVFSSVPTL